MSANRKSTQLLPLSEVVCSGCMSKGQWDEADESEPADIVKLYDCRVCGSDQRAPPGGVRPRHDRARAPA